SFTVFTSFVGLELSNQIHIPKKLGIVSEIGFENSDDMVFGFSRINFPKCAISKNPLMFQLSITGAEKVSHSLCEIYTRCNFSLNKCLQMVRKIRLQKF